MEDGLMKIIKPGQETVIIRLEDGKQRVERLSRRPQKEAYPLKMQ